MKLSDIKHIIDEYFDNVDPAEVVRHFEEIGYKFEPISDMEKCIPGCKSFTGGEIRHHKDCPYYKGSLSEKYDSIDRGIDWKLLRDKYFKECVMMDVSSDKSYNTLKINRAPHDLFEWFKLQVNSYY